MESRISKFRGHYILCGFGHIGHLKRPAISQLEKIAGGDSL